MPGKVADSARADPRVLGSAAQRIHSWLGDLDTDKNLAAGTARHFGLAGFQRAIGRDQAIAEAAERARVARGFPVA